MQDVFLTLGDYGESRIEIKQSEFIGRAKRIYSSEEAEQFVSETRSLYPDARHSCYAWIFDGTMHMQKYSDDGEPSGTAGMPILNVIEKQELTNLVVVVTRYFGGILLGKGGLVRAYTEAAIKALEAAGKVRISKGIAFQIITDYPTSEKLIFALNSKGWSIEDIKYSDSVDITCVVDKTFEEEIINFVVDKTAGKSTPVKIGERELKTAL